MERILLTDTQGVLWTFESQNRLSYTKEKEAPQILINDSSSEFDVITDKNGNFHIITQDSSGNMIYLTYDFVNWKKYTILKSKSGKVNMRGFKLFIHCENVHCLYILDSGGKNILVHHTFSPSEAATTPKAIAHVGDGKFSCAMDEKGIIHILYITDRGDTKYKIYKDGKYTEENLPDEESIRNISCIYHDRIYIIYIAKMKTYKTVVYYDPLSMTKKIINFSDGSISDCTVYGNKNRICIQWIERFRLYQCISDNRGETFGKPTLLSKNDGFIRIRSGTDPYTMHADRCAGYPSSIPTSHSYSEKADSDNNKTIELEKIKNTLIKQSEKIRRLEKELSELKTKMPEPKKTESKSNIGEVNEENYRAFQSADINEMDFENSRIFNKE